MTEHKLTCGENGVRLDKFLSVAGIVSADGIAGLLRHDVHGSSYEHCKYSKSFHNFSVSLSVVNYPNVFWWQRYRKTREEQNNNLLFQLEVTSAKPKL